MSELVTQVATSGTWVRQGAPSTPYAAGSKTWQYVGNPTGNVYQSFVYTPLPPDLAGRKVLAAYLEYEMAPATGASRRTTVQRHAKPSTGSYTAMTYANRPAVLAGSVPHDLDQSPAVTTRIHDVTADIVAIQQGAPFYGWRITSTYAGQWALFGWQTGSPVTLTIEVTDYPTTPTGLAPAGIVSIAQPVFQWNAPDLILSARMQVEVLGGNFENPLRDSGVIPVTSAQLGFADFPTSTSLADGQSVQVRVQHTTDLGTSDWGDPIVVTRDAFGSFTVTSPGATTTDPTPPAAWSFADQERWQVTRSVNGKVVADTGWQPGDTTAYSPAKGATKAGDVISTRIRVTDSVARTASPGDPGYLQITVDTVYSPGLAPAITSLIVQQDGVRPWVDIDWTRDTLPDEWIIVRDGDIIDRIPAVAGGNPVWSYRDYTCPPNRRAQYQVQPYAGNASGAVGMTYEVQTEVDGVWLIDPDTEQHFSISGTPGLAQQESSVWFTPTGAAQSFKRTYALRGLEGDVTGSLDTWFDGRHWTEQEADLYALKAKTSKTLRYVGGDVNIPVRVSDLVSVIDSEQSTTDDIVKAVSFTAKQNGELPYPEIVP